MMEQDNPKIGFKWKLIYRGIAVVYGRAGKTLTAYGFDDVATATVNIPTKLSDLTVTEPLAIANGGTGAAAIINCHTNAAVSATDIGVNMTAHLVFNGESWVLTNPAS